MSGRAREGERAKGRNGLTLEIRLRVLVVVLVVIFESLDSTGAFERLLFPPLFGREPVQSESALLRGFEDVFATVGGGEPRADGSVRFEDVAVDNVDPSSG